jgi:hypothetical protein
MVECKIINDVPSFKFGQTLSQVERIGGDSERIYVMQEQNPPTLLMESGTSPNSHISMILIDIHSKISSKAKFTLWTMWQSPAHYRPLWRLDGCVGWSSADHTRASSRYAQSFHLSDDSYEFFETAMHAHRNLVLEGFLTLCT